MLNQLVHLVDGALKILAGILILNESAAVHCACSGLAVHDVDLGCSRADREDVVVIALRSAEHIVSRCGTLAERNLEHRELRGLDRVDQALAETKQLCLLRLVVDIDTGRILHPEDRETVAAAEGHELVHLDQALTVELTAHTHSALASVLRIVRVALHCEHTLTVCDDTDRKAVDLCDTGDHLRAVVLLVLHELAAVDERLQDIVHVIGAAGVARHDVIELFALNCRCLRRIDPEELRIECRHVVHVLLDGIQNAELLRIDLAEETGHVVVDGDGARRVVLHLSGRIDHALCTLEVHVRLGIHAADNACAADCHVCLLVRNQNGRGNCVIAAARRVRAVDTDNDRNAELVQLRVAIEGRAAASAVRVNLLLLVELNAGAVQNVDQRNAEHLRRVGTAKQVVCLAGNPSARHLLVVGCDDHSPLAVDATKALDNTGGDDTDLLLRIVLRVVERVDRAEGALVNELIDSLECRVLALRVNLVIRRTRREKLLCACVDVLLDFL